MIKVLSVEYYKNERRLNSCANYTNTKIKTVTIKVLKVVLLKIHQIIREKKKRLK
jgi:hypothetical protein